MVSRNRKSNYKDPGKGVASSSSSSSSSELSSITKSRSGIVLKAKSAAIKSSRVVRRLGVGRGTGRGLLLSVFLLLVRLGPGAGTGVGFGGWCRRVNLRRILAGAEGAGRGAVVLLPTEARQIGQVFARPNHCVRQGL